jgi:hypothetical protein
MDDWREFAEQMASLARDLLAQESVNDTLKRISFSATELVEGCDAAGILILRGSHVQSLAPTGQVVVDSDELQGRVGETPHGPPRGSGSSGSPTSPTRPGAGPSTCPRHASSVWAA